MQGAQSCKVLRLSRETKIRGTFLHLLLAASQNEASKMRKSDCCFCSCFIWSIWGYVCTTDGRGIIAGWATGSRAVVMSGEQACQENQDDLVPGAAQLCFEHIPHHSGFTTTPSSLCWKQSQRRALLSNIWVCSTCLHPADSFSQETLLAPFSCMKNWDPQRLRDLPNSQTSTTAATSFTLPISLTAGMLQINSVIPEFGGQHHRTRQQGWYKDVSPWPLPQKK